MFASTARKCNRWRPTTRRRPTTVTLAAAAAAGRHVLSFAYHGRLETMARGLFVQPYVGPRGRNSLILSTKMESTEARRMFPCWDEPAFRATFELTATVPANWGTVSNMPVAHRSVHGRHGHDHLPALTADAVLPDRIHGRRAGFNQRAERRRTARYLDRARA